ncbi:EamA family transporter [Desertibacillus haloalkaliphilus]|nr:EamA family transporter [Desertibacillus haloalkaliphilus]
MRDHSPLFTVLFARLLINERLSKLQISGFWLALLGVSILVLST